ncbi:hypothetical protein DPMN_063060 [Dreissena polymorpha]|uniref:Hexosyltransferase n=1 Tax=Dreissena polymorpha TaxID=45954 RepID=A0A9D4CAQ8_DREPO|nr:hypothetical protein DPMN_063060 [Dreissena polymorpha]
MRQIKCFACMSCMLLLLGINLAIFTFTRYHASVAEMSIEEYAHAYFTPSDYVVTPIEEDYMIDGRQLCEGLSGKSVILLIPSTINSFQSRQILRNTWIGSLKNKVWPERELQHSYRAVFVFGQNYNAQENTRLLEESRIYGDVIQGNFKDSYNNLTRKTLFGLKWVLNYCNQIDYVIKVDIDTFVHIPKLMAQVAKFTPSFEGEIFGRLWKDAEARRDGKWKIDIKDYPLRKYPPYCDGPIYVISASALPRIVHTSQYMDYFPFEDVFVTGILAKIARVRRIDVLPSLELRNEPERVCSFHFGEHDATSNIADSDYSPKQIERIWTCLKYGPGVLDYYHQYKYHTMIVLPFCVLFVVALSKELARILNDHSFKWVAIDAYAKIYEFAY